MPVTVHPANTPVGRFGIQTVLNSPDPFIATMPVAGLRNPLTGTLALGSLTVLVDYVGGLVNHHRRGPDEWTVSGELALDLVPGAAAVIAGDPETPVTGVAHPLGGKGTTSLGVCELRVGDRPIGTGSVRSVHISRPVVFDDPHDQRAVHDGPLPVTLADLMAVRPGAGAVLYQSPNSALNNDMGIVNGGIAAAGLELVAAAALAEGRDEPLETASIRVSFLRPLLCGKDSRYVGTVVRGGRRTGVADAEAIGADGEVALTARLTAYA